MKFVLLVYHGPNPALPGSDRWKALPEAEQKAIYADYAEINKAEGMIGGPPLGLPHAAKTVQVRDGKTHAKDEAPHATSATVFRAEHRQLPRVATSDGGFPTTASVCSSRSSFVESGRGDWIRTSDPCAQGKLGVAFEVLFSEQFAASENSWAQIWAHPSGDRSLLTVTAGNSRTRCRADVKY